jgi:hypothetical protein
MRRQPSKKLYTAVPLPLCPRSDSFEKALPGILSVIPREKRKYLRSGLAKNRAEESRSGAEESSHLLLHIEFLSNRSGG